MRTIHEVTVPVITVSETRIRRKFADAPTAYARIISVDGLDVTDPISPEAVRTNVQLPFKNETSLEYFRQYFKEFHATSQRNRSGTNCARFALAMTGVEVERYRDAFAPLSEAILPENTWPETVPLPLGAVGVMGTLEPSPDRPFGPHFCHAVVGTGTELTLQDMAVKGFSGLRSLKDTLAYVRTEASGEHRPDRTLFAPEDVQLFVLPSSMR